MSDRSQSSRHRGNQKHRMGPPLDSVQLVYKWLNSMVYGRYIYIYDITIVFMGIISWLINQLITGGPHPASGICSQLQSLVLGSIGATPFIDADGTQLLKKNMAGEARKWLVNQWILDIFSIENGHRNG